MKVSYNVLKSYFPELNSPEETAQKLIMHTAEVEDIHMDGQNLEGVFIGEIVEVKKHPEADKLNLCQVSINGETVQIVCGAPNVKPGIKVPVAIVGAALAPDFVIQKTKIRWETSNGMICSEDELGMVEERQDGILILPDDAKLWTCMKDYLEKNDSVLEIDNKAINHRPDMFSYIGVIRELYATYGKSFDFEYENRDFSSLPDIGIKNEIQDIVRRYIGLKIEWVSNIESPKYIKDILSAAEVESKGLLVDVTNYCLNLYWQPTHCFDADKLNWSITVRYAKDGETFTALNDKEYKLSPEDIVIADDAWIIALGGIIGWKDSAVSDTTKNIIVESANFDQAVVRKTGKRLGLRTDALNVFEKDILLESAQRWVSLIATELEKKLDGIKITGISDIYPSMQKAVTVPFDPNFINNLIGANYSEDEMLQILKNLWIEAHKDNLHIPFWRKDINTKADIAEEIARIHGYDNITPTVPDLNLWAIMQDDIYTLKKKAKKFLVNRWFFDMYNYSFVNEDLMQKTLSDTFDLIGLKNYLSEEITHMRWDLIPNLLLSVEKNIREAKHMNLFEVGKVFHKNGNEITEHLSISGLMVSDKDIGYYETQSLVSDLLISIWVDKFSFEETEDTPSYAHSWRTATVVVRWKSVWYIGEIHPKVSGNFDVKTRISFFCLDADMLSESTSGIKKSKEVSSFQENNFDITFVVDKSTAWKNIRIAIEKTDTNIIQRVELFDVYEDEQKLPGQRSLSFKVYIQSLESTLDDKVKNDIINRIVERVSKKWGELRK